MSLVSGLLIVLAVLQTMAQAEPKDKADDPTQKRT